MTDGIIQRLKGRKWKGQRWRGKVSLNLLKEHNLPSLKSINSSIRGIKSLKITRNGREISIVQNTAAEKYVAEVKGCHNLSPKPRKWFRFPKKTPWKWLKLILWNPSTPILSSSRWKGRF